MSLSDIEDDPEDLLIQWRELLLRWTNSNQHRLDMGALSEGEQHEILREWWAITSEVLWLNVRIGHVDGVEITPPPLTLLATLAHLAGDLSNGVPSDLLHGMITPGAPRRSAKERLGISWAIRYIDAARQGLISDRSYNKTVRTAYDVSAATVRDWMNRRDEICAGIPKTSLSPDQLRSKMLSAGKLHMTISRSHSAIEKRSYIKSRG